MNESDCDWQDRYSKSTHAILLCPLEKYFLVLFLVRGSWQTMINFSDISNKNQNKKFQRDSNVLAFQKAGRDNWLTVTICILYIRRFPESQKDKHRNKITNFYQFFIKDFSAIASKTELGCKKSKPVLPYCIAIWRLPT